MEEIKKSKAYDLPVRIFHWAFAMLFIISFSIGKFVDDDSTLYAYHMLSGLMMAFLVMLRLLWGVIGSPTARLSSLPLKPSALIAYLSSLFSQGSKRYLGHNPGSGQAFFLMVLFSLALAGSGLGMVLTGNEDLFEDLHELLGHGFLIVVILHIGGVLFHERRHRDGMISSMITGRKNKIAGVQGLKSNHPIVALVLIVSILGASNYLLGNFNKQRRTLTLMGNSIYLGEKEDHDRRHGKASEKLYNDYRRDNDHDDDD